MRELRTIEDSPLSAQPAPARCPFRALREGLSAAGATPAAESAQWDGVFQKASFLPQLQRYSAGDFADFDDRLTDRPEDSNSIPGTKQERYALLTLLLKQEIWPRYQLIRQGAPELGLLSVNGSRIRELSYRDIDELPVQCVPGFVVSTQVSMFSAAIRDFMDTPIECFSWTPALRARQLLQLMLDPRPPATASGLHNEFAEEPARLLFTGASFAQVSTWSLIELVPVLLEQHGIRLEPSVLAEITMNSYTNVLVATAKLHRNLAMPLTHSWRRPGMTSLDPNWFELDLPRKQICPRNELIQNVAKVVEADKGEAEEPQLGCPFLFTAGFRQHWEQNIALARRIYFPRRAKGIQIDFRAAPEDDL